MSERPKILRCAIYTRKSTEHNLDLEFNSLHAQREACEAYIKSQLHEGWRLIPDSYDDGGISGGSLDRPDLQRLLVDIAVGKVDTVVVYKVDRLTRSLTDFAKLVELFDRHQVSFVSVTQAFNTTTSMGRLTLNVLLSFAQFEREVIGERVRDKIAASKRKGLWMGGPVPLGYVAKEKKLVVVPEEADRVRWMFNKYLELRSIGLLLEEMDRLNIRTRVQVLSNGQKRGGVLYGKGPLAHILKNRCYVGEIAHKGLIHAADHVAIVTKDIFEAVQASLATNTIERTLKSRPSDFLLTGLIYDSVGNRLTPSHSRKKGVRYRYYVSQAILQSRKRHAGDICRVPAPEIEAQIERFIRQRCAGVVEDLRALIESQIARIRIQPAYIEVSLKHPGTEGVDQSLDNSSLVEQTIQLPWSKKPFRVPKGLAYEPSVALEDANKAKEVFLTAVAKARHWLEELTAGGGLPEIARREDRSQRQIRFLLPLAFVPPKMVRDIMEDRMRAPGITELAKRVPVTWD